MESSAPEKNEEFVKPEPLTFRNILQQVDSKVYKELLIFLGVALLIATGFYIYLRIGQEMVVREQTKPDEKRVVVEDTKSEETKTKFSQDQQRKNDIVIINSALKSFFLTNKKAPKTLGELVPKDLPQLPTDPKTNKEYGFSPAADQQTWTVWASLSDGKKFEVSGP